MYDNLDECVAHCVLHSEIDCENAMNEQNGLNEIEIAERSMNA